jgi:heme/copper-type cytochrome/quinol oxidase subunit 4
MKKNDTKALAKLGTAGFAVAGFVAMLIFGSIAYFVTQNNAIRIAAVVIPFIIALIAIINLQLQANRKK